MWAHVGGKQNWIWDDLGWLSIFGLGLHQQPMSMALVRKLVHPDLRKSAVESLWSWQSWPDSLLQSNHVESLGCRLYRGDEWIRTPFSAWTRCVACYRTHIVRWIHETGMQPPWGWPAEVDWSGIFLDGVWSSGSIHSRLGRLERHDKAANLTRLLPTGVHWEAEAGKDLMKSGWSWWKMWWCVCSDGRGLQSQIIPDWVSANAAPWASFSAALALHPPAWF